MARWFRIAWVVAIVVAGTLPLAAQQGGDAGRVPPASGAAPLGSMLDGDGALRLDRGFAGSLDPSGWRLRLDRDGRPRFIADTADSHWDDRFLPSAGLNARVTALAVHAGRVYVGGEFSAAANMPANSIAVWDGSAWSALGDGLTSSGYPASVTAMAFAGDDLYVAGTFQNAGGVEAPGIARWNGTAWSALGRGLVGVQALAVDGNYLYAGGGFAGSGSVVAPGIARWSLSGGGWEALPGGALAGLSVTVNAIEPIPGGGLYVAGSFDSAGAVAASNIARWSGSAWTALARGVDGPVGKLLLRGDSLYVAGAFMLADERDAFHVARWSGGAWSAVPGVLADETAANFVTWWVAAPNGDIWASSAVAAFDTPVGYRSDLTRYDASSRSWGVVERGLDGGILAMAVLDGGLYAGGRFNAIDSVPAVNIVRRDLASGAWGRLGGQRGNAPDGAVRAVAVRGDEVFIGGSFGNVGGIAAAGIARWNARDNTWSALGKPLSGAAQVNALAIEGDNLFVGGRFLASTVTGNSDQLARWDGKMWWAIPGLMGGDVLALAVGGGNLFVGGTFDRLHFSPASHVLRWHIFLEEWRRLGPGLDGNVEAIAAAANGRDIYFGGTFANAGSTQVKGIARWNMLDTVWTPVGGGIMNDTAVGEVNALAFNGRTLYAAGRFTRAGTTAAASIARWDGSAWTAVGGGLTTGERIASLAVAPNGDVFAGGSFSAIGGTAANNIARFDTLLGAWSAVGSGTDAPVNAVATGGRNLFIGGAFRRAGTTVSNFVGRWEGLPEPPASVDRPASGAGAAIALRGVPNPASSRAELRFSLPASCAVRIAVYDVLGTEVAVVADAPMESGDHRIAFDPSALRPGIYYCRLESPAGRATAAIVIR